MIALNRAALVRALEEALGASKPGEQLRCLIRDIIVTEPVPEDPEEELGRYVVARLDMADDPERLVELSSDVRVLLTYASSAEAVELLLEVVAERWRVLLVLRKHFEGTISRTSLLSFISEQRWPIEVRRRFSSLSADELKEMVEALEQPNIHVLERTLLGGGWPG